VWLAKKLESGLAIYAYAGPFRVWIPGYPDSRTDILTDTSVRPGHSSDVWSCPGYTKSPGPNNDRAFPTTGPEKETEMAERLSTPHHHPNEDTRTSACYLQTTGHSLVL
jgi:hypothetical protein